jgi:hypothetical protein
MFDVRRRIVEMMKKALPFLVFGGAAEADSVALDRVPPYDQDITILTVCGSMNLVPKTTCRGSEDVSSFVERLQV